MEDLAVPHNTSTEQRDPTVWSAAADAHFEEEPPSKLDLRCTRCGYGVLRPTPPRRCPMCQTENAWIYAPRVASPTSR
jgi:rubrerythrin